MEVLRLATKTLQLAIQTAIDGVRSVVDGIKTTTDSTKVAVDATKANVDTLLAGRVVKSVQRGSFSASTTTHTVQIGVIAPNKVHIELYGVTNSGGFAPRVTNVTTTSFVVDAGNSVSTFNNAVPVSWEVVEFY
ncbi:hypothetical protein [Lysinibacillus sp. FSL W8-0992]|uniref:hypothetical protein n=1 Tax=Lysinibacillus sp. FSL W8-0992 TaxID=2954643 RepID=UPI0030FBB167